MHTEHKPLSELPPDDFWGETTPESRQEWEAWKGTPGHTEQPQAPEATEELELPKPQEVPEHAARPASPGWKRRIQRLGTAMLRHLQKDAEPSGSSFDAADELETNGPQAHETYETPSTDNVSAPETKAKVARNVQDDLWASWASLPAREPAPAPALSESAEPERSMRYPNAELFEEQGFIKEAPYLDEQVEDTSRTNTFRYSPLQSRRVSHAEPEAEVPEAVVTTTEHEGLVALQAFLDAASNQHLKVKGRDVSEAAGIIARKLTFIGEKECAEAAHGIKEIWKAYLDEDPAHVLHLVAGVSDTRRARKSDQYVTERILDEFSSDELEAYSGRIKLGVDEVTSAPDKTKIILVDDWTMSGSQLRGAAEEMFNNPRLDAYRKGFEINLLAASDFWIRRGLHTIYAQRGSNDIPVKAYYKTHDFSPQTASARAVFEPIAGQAPLTGVHSSGDFGFENVIHDIVAAQRAQGQESDMPPLTNIVRQYRNTVSPIYMQNGVIRKR